LKRQKISSGTSWEKTAGYSRAVKAGNHVFIAGTTAVDNNGEIIGRGDIFKQTKFIFEKIESALYQCGCSLEDIVRTRMYVTDISSWEEAARAHGEIFAEIRPASTLVEVSSLVDRDLLIEIEAEAVSDKI
jgi:enamine deaminase RidA (YjgF/YER057c/UK114 family)